ncbi:MAG: hypothetical protein V4714_01430 [Bacteroidota bacterium]
MKHLFLLIIISFATLNTFAQDLSCKKFRNGTFKLMNENRITIIKRAGSEQLEYFNGSKTPTSYSVSWLDDCTYVLRPKAEVFKKYPGMPKDAALTVKIIKTTANSYTQTTTSNFSDNVLTGEVIRIK